VKEQKIQPGISIIGFESQEEMAAYMAEQEALATADALPEQWEITWGDRVLRMVDDTLAVFGHIFTEREFLAENSKPGQAPDEEILYELDSLRDAHTRGYRYGRWYSTVEPDGEYGSAHVVSLWGISKQDFATARSNGWRLWPELSDRVYSAASEAAARSGK
jgi:hypothetical protein